MGQHRSVGASVLVIGVLILTLMACTPDPVQTFLQGTWVYTDLHLAQISAEQYLEVFWVFVGDSYETDSCCFGGQTYERGNYRLVEAEDGNLVLELYNREGHIAGIALDGTATGQVKIVLDEQNDTLKIGRAIYTRYEGPDENEGNP